MHASVPVLFTDPQAAAVEVGTSLVNTVAGPSGKDTKNAGDQGKGKGPAVPEPLKMVGGIGMELLRVSHTLAHTVCTLPIFPALCCAVLYCHCQAIAAVRDAMLDPVSMQRSTCHNSSAGCLTH
jgi:hypothetical protein